MYHYSIILVVALFFKIFLSKQIGSFQLNWDFNFENGFISHKYSSCNDSCHVDQPSDKRKREIVL